MTIFRTSRLATAIAVALSLTACGNSDNPTPATQSSASTTTTTTTTTPSTPSSSADVLDPTQTQLSGIVSGLGGQLTTAIDNNGSPLKVGALVTCLDPTLNQVIEGPNVLLTNLLQTINTDVNSQINPKADLDPSQLQPGVTALATALQSLTTNLPHALLALAGQGTCSSDGTFTGTSSSSSDPLQTLISLAKQGSNGPLKPLLTALSNAGVPSGTTTGTPIDIILDPLTKLAGTGSSSLTDINDLADVVALLGHGVQTLGTALTANIPSQVTDAPVIGGLVTTLGTTVANLGDVLSTLDSANSTNQALLNTVQDLLTGLGTTLSGLPGASALSSQTQGAISQLTTALGKVTLPLSQLLATVTALPDSTTALSTSQIPVLGGLLSQLLPASTSTTTSASGSTTSSSGSLSASGATSALNSIPVVGPLLGGLLGTI